MQAVHVQNLTHRYQNVTALDHIDLTIEPGEIFGILGPNGGGKTTLFRILATLLRPSEGCAKIFDCDVATNPAAVRAQLGVVFQSPSLDIQLTAKENMTHQGRLYGLSGADLQSRIATWLSKVNLSDRANDLTKTFSGGMRRRVELAKAMLHDPKLLLLDEPATGLDPAARRDVWLQLTELRDKNNLTALLTTHLMDEADRCDRLAVIHQGKIVAVDTPANLKSAIRGHVITIITNSDPAALAKRITNNFAPWPQETAPRVVDSTIYLEKPDGPAAIAKIAQMFTGEIQSITLSQPTLEDVFLHLTGDKFGDEASE